MCTLLPAQCTWRNQVLIVKVTPRLSWVCGHPQVWAVTLSAPPGLTCPRSCTVSLALMLPWKIPTKTRWRTVEPCERFMCTFYVCFGAVLLLRNTGRTELRKLQPAKPSGGGFHTHVHASLTSAGSSWPLAGDGGASAPRPASHSEASVFPLGLGLSLWSLWPGRLPAQAREDVLKSRSHCFIAFTLCWVPVWDRE